MLNWFSCKPASVEPVAIDRKPKTLTEGVQDPEVQRQLDAVRRIIDAYSDDAGSIAWEHTKAISEALRELLISPGVSEHDFLIVYQAWTALIDDLRVTAAAHGAATQLDQARQTSETEIDFIHYVINPDAGDVCLGGRRFCARWLHRRRSSGVAAARDLGARFSDRLPGVNRRYGRLVRHRRRAEQHMPETAKKFH